MRNFFGFFTRHKRFRAALSEHVKMLEALRPEEFIPNGTFDDVQRIVRRDFPTDEVDAVLDVLKGYGVESWHTEQFRVYLAILKLSNGDIDAVRRQLNVAKSDFREVLGPAESPGFFRIGFVGATKLTKEEIIQLMNADRDQYNAWLIRSDEKTNE